MSDFKLVKLIDPAVVVSVAGGLNPEGAYNAGTTYTVGDSVSYNGSSYIALTTTTGNLPTNTAFWQVLASKGDTGATGPQGPQGEPGSTFSIPELDTDPVSPDAGYTWVKKNSVSVAPILSHTLLHFGLTAPGSISINEYKLKYKTVSGAVVGVTLT